MKTIAIIFGYFFLCTPLRFIGNSLMKIVGLPGALIAFKVTSQKHPRYILGLLICLATHVYTYVAIEIYIMNWTRHLLHPNSISKYFIWFFCLILLTVVMEGIYRTAKNESEEDKPEDSKIPNYINPQIMSLKITRVFVLIGFWVFLFFPKYTSPLWSWVNDIGFLI